MLYRLSRQYVYLKRQHIYKKNAVHAAAIVSQQTNFPFFS